MVRQRIVSLRGPVVVIAAAILALCWPVTAGQAAAKHVVVDYDFAPPVVTRQPDGTDRVEAAGLRRLSQPGKPVLPYRSAFLALPPATEVVKVSVTEAAWQNLPGTYAVEPGQQPLPLTQAGAKPERTPSDPATYASRDWFPTRSWSSWSVQRWRGHSLLVVNLSPVRYLPAAGKLQWCRRISVRVDLRAATPEETRTRLRASDRPSDLAYLRAHVDNPGALDSRDLSSETGPPSQLLDPSQPLDYVIITSLNMYGFEDLVTAKQAAGLTAGIVATEWIYANYSGARPDGGWDNQTQIRNFIADAYNTWGTQWVLLGGDADGASIGGETEPPIVPERGLAALDDSDIASDLYYGCLDGTFDANANGL